MKNCSDKKSKNLIFIITVCVNMSMGITVNIK